MRQKFFHTLAAFLMFMAPFSVCVSSQVNTDTTAMTWTSSASTATIKAGDYIQLDGLRMTFGSSDDAATTWSWHSGNSGLIPTQMPSVDGTAATLVTTFSEEAPYGTVPTHGNFFRLDAEETGVLTVSCKPSTNAAQLLVLLTMDGDDIESVNVNSGIWDSSYHYELEAGKSYRLFQLAYPGQLSGYRYTLRGITFEKADTNAGTNVTNRICEVEASYTASWNYLYAVYDGTKGFGELANNKTWGSWSENRPSTQWIRYGWNEQVTANQVNVYFWTDTENPGGGVAVPESWRIQYYDEELNQWTDVNLLEDQTYSCKRLAVNTVKFQPVKTRQIRLMMEAQTNGTTFSALGVTEWEVFGTIEEKEVVYGDYPIQNVDFSQVHLTDKFWTARMRQNQTVTIPIALEQCEKTNRMLNFEKAAAILRGENIGYFDTENTFDDTDIYKILEGMAYSIQTSYSKEMDDKMDELIALVGSAQEPDGYLYTPRTAGKPGALHSWVGAKRWEKDPDLSHELYNCGHLYEAAVAHYISTGKRSLLDIAIKNADLLVNDFLIGGLTYEPGHQIVEMGLVKMYRVTGKEDYLKLAKYFLDLRGLKGVMRKEYSQTNKPVIMQDEAVGHAVRAAYMYSGMADVAAIMGDESYLNAIDKIWHNVVEKKYYITGGIGGKINGEAFDVNYVLPNREAYCETCAAIGNVYWNWRMFLLHGEAKYYDVIERTLYNGLISGISLTGDHFFYPNPLACNGTSSAVSGRDIVRSEWFGCACCPSNLCRFTASVPGYIYAHRNDSVYVNLYIQGTGNIDLPEGTVTLTQTTGMPWQGDVCIHVDKTIDSEFAMMLRLPGWANGEPVPSDLYTYLHPKKADIEVKVNGNVINYEMINGYMVIKRNWADGDEVSFELPMDTHLVVANEQVEADRGRMSIERGPVVYCLESPDNADASGWYVTENAEMSPVWTDELNGLMELNIEEQDAGDTVNKLTAIPYYAWANRGKARMEVWISSAKEAYPVTVNVNNVNVVGEKDVTIDYFPVNDGWATHNVSGYPVDDVPALLDYPLSGFTLNMMYVKTDDEQLCRTKCASGGNGFWLQKQGKEAGELFNELDDMSANRRIFLNVDGFYQPDQTVKVGFGQCPNSCQTGVYETGLYMLTPRDDNDQWKAYRVNMRFNLMGSRLDENADYELEAEGITALMLERYIPKDTWTTLVLPVSLTQSQLKEAFGDNVRVAALESGGADGLNFKSVNTTVANQPFIIRTESDFNETTINDVNINVDTPRLQVSDAAFIGSYSAAATVPAGAFVMKDNKLMKTGSEYTMHGTYAYFDVPEASSANINSLSFVIDGEVTTGISEMNYSLNGNGDWYNLQGQQVSKPIIGIYIRDGKKVLFK